MKLFQLNSNDQILLSLYNFVSFYFPYHLTLSFFPFRYKRDYYINENHHQQSPSPTVSSPISPKHITPTLDASNDEIITPKKKAYEEMTVSMLIGDMEMPLKYTRHDQDYSLTTLNSLTMSEDSETLRIYTPSTQETKLIAPHAERISTTKGFPVATTDESSEIGKIDDSSIKVSDEESSLGETISNLLNFLLMLCRVKLSMKTFMRRGKLLSQKSLSICHRLENLLSFTSKKALLRLLTIQRTTQL